jgi:hypothetical protein
MGVANPEQWVEELERLYRSHNAEAVRELYTDGAQTRFASTIFPPEWVHAHPQEWFSSLEDYQITRTFRAATGDIIVSETTASYVLKEDGQKYHEFGVDIYWVNDAGKIYHKHTMETVQPYKADALRDVDRVCGRHDIRNAD